ncbi:hypothetical protein EYC80_009047 [Monilinia laxa]|uniref:Uncharacterized protein n=1 Tax=Monilinia laxa TaxID=61186 RepID=A0A5N6K284_MONLA|nr:hypothetical protein EYC80_009047 [Monilinia laxa]
MPNNDLVIKIDSVIKKIINYGQEATEESFRLYVTGYAQIFNDQDTACNSVIFARTANPTPDGKPHPMMTTELRQEFNWMSLTLNATIQKAVSQNGGSNAKYIDIDVLLGGEHPFCEPGVKEPDLNNPNLCFWHYPYNQNDYNEDPIHPTIKYLNSVQSSNVNNLTWDQNSTLWTDYLNDFWSKVDEEQLNQTLGGNVKILIDPWPDFVGYRARQYISGTGAGTKTVATSSVSTTSSPPTNLPSSSPSSPPAYATGTCCFHLIEAKDCKPVTNNLYANMTLVDNDKKVIYKTPESYFDNNGWGIPINDGNDTTIQGPLPNTIAITGEHENDYIQFIYGTLSWTSKKANGGAQCTTGGWDLRKDPGCGDFLFGKDWPSRNQMDCCFPC